MKKVAICLFLLAFSVVYCLNTPSGTAQLTPGSIEKNGVSVELLSNTDFCDEDCSTQYRICITNPLTRSIGDLSFKFRKNETDSLKDFAGILKEAPRIDVRPTVTPNCYTVRIDGKKGKFEDIDNVVEFKGDVWDIWAWWNTTYRCRIEIDFINTPPVGFPFVVNDTYGLNGQFIYTKKVSETMYAYFIDPNCTGSDIAIGNETDELEWEFGQNHTGVNTTNVWSNEYAVYHLDEGSGQEVNDSGSGNFNSIQFKGVEGWNPSGRFGYNFEFNDSASRNIQIADITSIFEGDKNYSVSAWVNSDSPGNDGMILGCMDLADTNHDWRFITDSSNRLALVTYEFGYLTLLSTYFLEPGTWYYAVAVVNDTQGAKLYANGTFITEGQINNLSGMDYCHIGINNNTAQPWDGRIDEVRVYNYSLTQSEITYNWYNGINNLSYPGVNESLGPVVVPPVPLNVTIIHDTTNLYPTNSACLDNYTLYREFLEQKCTNFQGNMSCINVSSSQIVPCVYGCDPEISMFGAECVQPDYIIIGIVMFILFIFPMLYLWGRRR